MSLTPEQYQQLLIVVQAVWDGIMGADEGGPLNSLRENKAAADYVTDSKGEFADNAIVQQLIGSLTPGGGDGLDADGIQEAITLALAPNTLMQHIGALSQVLNQHPDGMGVKEFIYGLAEAIAEAAGTQRFGGGDKVSDTEKQWLDALAAWLTV